MRKTLVPLLSAFVLLATAHAGDVASNDWPQFRGPNRDDVSTETGLLKQWPADGPTLAWKAEGIGRGYSSVSVAGGKIFTMGDKEGASHVYALDLNGKIVWDAKVGKPGGNYDGTRSTPTVDGNFVYALGQFADLVCLNAADGKEVWRKNLETDFGGKMMSGWNFTESVLIDGKQLICTPGGQNGTMIALDKTNGSKIWQSAEITDKAAYSSAIAADIGGVHQYIQLTGNAQTKKNGVKTVDGTGHVFGVDAKTGKLLWQADRSGGTAVIPTPIYFDNHVFVTSGYGAGCSCFKITAEGGAFSAKEVYSNKEMTDHHGGVLRVGENLYGHSDNGGWKCMEMKTGKVLWKNPGVGKGSLTFADGHLYLRSEAGSGRIALVEASPEAYKQTGEFNQPNRAKENSWPHPVVSGGKLYIRDQDILLCYDIKAK